MEFHWGWEADMSKRFTTLIKKKKNEHFENCITQ